MFSVEDRERLRATLIEAARSDERIDGAATLGSAARGELDAVSDIDLALGTAPGADRDALLADWTRVLYEEHGAVDHLDVLSRNAIYRVFLMRDTLQIDLSFWMPGELRPYGPSFAPEFGRIGELVTGGARDRHELLGLAWLYLIHVRGSIARERPWQAEFMLAMTRTQLLELACERHGLPSHEARGTDRLPAPLLALAAATLPVSLEGAELERATAAVAALLLDEAAELDAALAGRLRPTIEELVATATALR